jgi:hypothetical protein
MNVILSFMLVLMPAAFPLRAVLIQTQQNPSVSLKDLRKAPTQVVLDNKTLQLSAYPWRDFMPGAWGPDGSPLMVVLKITSTDAQPLPNGLRLDHAWVLFGEESWEVSELRGRLGPRNEDQDSSINCSTKPKCEVTLRNGPKWGPRVRVDVVVHLTDSAGKEYFLQAPNQYVVRSD